MPEAHDRGAAVQILALTKSYPNVIRGREGATPVLDSIDLELPRGSLTTVFGPNGCGKTTLLGVLAGVIPADSGKVSVQPGNGQISRVGYVFQDYRATLFPWKRAIDNVAYPAVLRGQPRHSARRAAETLLDQFALRIPRRNYPYQLSGGQQQLTSIARALMSDPDLLLLDEPFSALDYETRSYMQQKVTEIWEEIRTTILFVSHELDEALYLADRVVFLTRRPARVLRVLEVDLARPRTPEVMESATFFRLRTEGLRTFREALSEKA
jgi:NitT/TauT family transport system ATP-binding protein